MRRANNSQEATEAAAAKYDRDMTSAALSRILAPQARTASKTKEQTAIERDVLLAAAQDVLVAMDTFLHRRGLSVTVARLMAKTLSEAIKKVGAS